MPSPSQKHLWVLVCFLALAFTISAQKPSEKQLPEPPRLPEHLGGSSDEERLWHPKAEAQPKAEVKKSSERPASRPIIRPPDNDTYVGVVDSRFLKKVEMDNRVNRMLVMSDALGWKDPQARESLRANLERMVLSEWAELTVLAVHAEGEGHRTSQAEIQEKLNEIYEQEEKAPEVGRTLRAVGISKEELIGYLRDGILAEKLVSSYIKQHFKPKDIQTVYQMVPGMFVIPERVELNYMAMQLSGEESLADRRRLMKEMEEWRKKASKKGKFLSVAEDFKEPELGQMGGYYGWATSRSLPRDDMSKASSNKGSIAVQSSGKIVKTVFGLGKGEISPVLISEKGLYIFQLIDRQKASGNQYDSAKPMVESAIYECVKSGLLGQIASEHTIHLVPGGINFDAIAEVKTSGKDLKALREQQRKERFFEHFGDRILQGGNERAIVEKTSGALSPEISSKSLEILRQGAAKSTTNPIEP